MSHRNVEIWRKRYALVEAIAVLREAQYAQVLNGAGLVDRALLKAHRQNFRKRAFRVERRVWHALCFAEGWRLQ